MQQVKVLFSKEMASMIIIMMMGKRMGEEIDKRRVVAW